MLPKVKTAVFPVAGLGTRFLPATKAIPKEMLPIAAKPLIQFAVEEAIAAGCERFVFVTGRNKNSIEDHFDDAFELQKVLQEKQKFEELRKVSEWMPQAGEMFFTRQRSPLGLGHAVWCARNFVGNEPFAVLLADEMFKINRPEENVLKTMIAYHDQAETKCNMLAVAAVEPEAISQYGVIQPQETFEFQGLHTSLVTAMVEKPQREQAPSNLAIVGRYVLEPEIFTILEQVQRGAGNEIQLTDGMEILLQQQPFYSMLLPCERFDCGSEIGYLAANIAQTVEKYPHNHWLQQVLQYYSHLTTTPSSN